MTILKKWQLVALLLANAVTFNACGANAESKKQSESKSVQSKTEAAQSTNQKGISKVQADINLAKKAGKAVFVVVTDASAIDTDKATSIAKGANTIYKNAVVVQFNRDDPANAQLVTEWRLAGAPLPLILVISPKGLPTGGYILSQATAENIAALIPSPKLENVYDAISNGKHAVVVFTKKSFADKAEVIKIANQAVAKLNKEAVFVEVDMDDSREVGFLNQLRIDKASTKASITLVINKQGQVAGTSTTIPDTDKLVAAATTPVAGGCGPGCGPAGCGK